MAPRQQDRQDHKRIDVVLVDQGLVATRSRARDLVLRGLVRVDGRIVVKPSEEIAASAKIIFEDERAAASVARSSEKLIAALDHFEFDPAARVCLDIGASTGGFSEVLLTRGARRIYAVDVGRGQLHPQIASDPRVVSLETTDARSLDRLTIPEPIEAIVADVSFISLTKALPAPLSLAIPGAWLVALVKPQFEAGRDAVGRGGIVRDEKARVSAVDAVARWLSARPGWRVHSPIPSPLQGGDGNQEYLLAAVLDD